MTNAISESASRYVVDEGTPMYDVSLEL